MVEKSVRQRIEEIIGDERQIDAYLKGLGQPKGTRSYVDKNFWYSTSYPIILKRFKETRDIPQDQKWSERIAWVYSWISSIPAGGLDTDAMIDLSILEQEYAFVNYEDTYIEIYHGSTFPEFHGDLVLSTRNNNKPVRISEFVRLADRIIHVNGNWNSTLSTTTKMLHFIFPEIFPIYDSKIHEIIFKSRLKNMSQYGLYILGLREFLQQSRTVDYIDSQLHAPHDRKFSKVRTIEMLLFQAA